MMSHHLTSITFQVNYSKPQSKKYTTSGFILDSPGGPTTTGGAATGGGVEALRHIPKQEFDDVGADGHMVRFRSNSPQLTLIKESKAKIYLVTHRSQA